MRRRPVHGVAPTDDAFATFADSLGEEGADFLVNESDTLTAVLTYHVVEGAVPSKTVLTLDGEEVTTVNGAAVEISVEGEAVTVNDANVVAVDVAACNGVIHVIDTVLLPPEAQPQPAEPADEEPAQLADTGSETGPVVIVAVGLVIAGAMLVSSSRRAQRLHTHR